MSLSNDQLEYSRHTLTAEDTRDLGRVLAAVARLPQVIAVNVATTPEAGAVLFSEENLEEVLAGHPAVLTIDVLPAAQYKQLMRHRIDRTIALGTSLREALRHEGVGQLGAQVRDVVIQLGQIGLMLGCYVLQQVRPALGVELEDLQRLVGQLSASAFQHGDNVRCMDDLHYEVLPALKQIRKTFG